MTLTKFGLREWGLSALFALLLIAASITLAILHAPATGFSLALFVLIIWLGIAAFFRNPHRKIPADVQLMMSPADGVIKDIEIVSDHGIEPFAGQDALRIGIFLSVLNVHLNRAPSDLELTYKHYRKGRYLDARHPDCHKENEAMTIGGTATVNNFAFPMAIRQVSGAIARRIVCPVEIGNKIERGAIYGMIKFGSRTELYIPVSDDFEVQVKIGDKVSAGISVMVKIAN
ncbi:MAG: phosphatidylserine decarboxylase family protein [Victivallales bacterium]|nr:phosphatidylserine decarboxylase family protein [Victivallales bacterium]